MGRTRVTNIERIYVAGKWEIVMTRPPVEKPPYTDSPDKDQGTTEFQVHPNISITREDIIKALEQWPNYVDSTPEDLIQIFNLASEQAKKRCQDKTLVCQVMTKSVVTLKPDATIEEAVQTLTARNIHGCPVVNNNMQVLGMVTESDLAFLAGGSKSSRLRDWFSLIFGKQEPITVKWNQTVELIMSKPPVTVNPHILIKDALSLMQERRIKIVPVVDEEKRLLGILSLHDILRQFAKGREL